MTVFELPSSGLSYAHCRQKGKEGQHSPLSFHLKRKSQPSSASSREWKRAAYTGWYFPVALQGNRQEGHRYYHPDIKAMNEE